MHEPGQQEKPELQRCYFQWSRNNPFALTRIIREDPTAATQAGIAKTLMKACLLHEAFDGDATAFHLSSRPGKDGSPVVASAEPLAVGCGRPHTRHNGIKAL